MSEALKPDRPTWITIVIRQANLEHSIKLVCPGCSHHLFTVEQNPIVGMVLRCCLCRQLSRIHPSLLVTLEQVSKSG
jgi:hypothetical protein